MRPAALLILASLLTGGCKSAANTLTECGRIENEIENEIAKGPGTCTTLTDCACYPGGSKASGCGGIARKETADRIKQLTDERRTKNCSEVACAAWICVPDCVSGTCTNGSVSVKTTAP